MKNIYTLLIVVLLAAILANFPGESGKNEDSDISHFTSARREMTEGVYRGTGAGFAGPIQVEVTFSRESSTSAVKMTDIEVLNQSEIEKYWEIVEDNILPHLAEKAPGEIDARTGATKSVKGLLEAIEDAKERSYRRNRSSSN